MVVLSCQTLIYQPVIPKTHSIRCDIGRALPNHLPPARPLSL